jgi:hypothetical protein
LGRDESLGRIEDQANDGTPLPKGEGQG